MPKYEPVIGLEVHAELLTRSKMFCGCAVVDSTQVEPNISVCEICTGMPGTLPVINQRAIEFALRVALALNCEIAEISVFARKNYFYPDLPKGYQISQYELPLARDGWLDLEVAEQRKRVQIRRVHLEEDTGKLFHRDSYSLVDFNRSGVPLLEIVTEPDMHSIEEVKAFSVGLRSLLRYLEVSSGDMEKGVIRFEANVSVRPVGAETLGTRTEIKNLNSFRAMVRALEYEVERQSALLDQGQEVVLQTVGWDEARSVTLPQRSKEEAHDYRYFPEPDLPPLQVDPEWVDEVRAGLPELPEAKRERFMNVYALSRYAAGVLVADATVADYYEASTDAAPEVSPVKIANWITGDLFGWLNEAGLEIQDSQLTPEALGSIVTMVEKDEITTTVGKTVLTEALESGEPPDKIVEARGLSQVSDPETISAFVRDVLNKNPEQVAEYLAGKEPLLQWFLGQVMHAAGGKADPALVRQILSTALEESRHAGG